eukprot:scaffold1590_cov239-Pinguiococcus_pyrenoidosus.AAC.16
MLTQMPDVQNRVGLSSLLFSEGEVGARPSWSAAPRTDDVSVWRRLLLFAGAVASRALAKVPLACDLPGP